MRVGVAICWENLSGLTGQYVSVMDRGTILTVGTLVSQCIKTVYYTTLLTVDIPNVCT